MTGKPPGSMVQKLCVDRFFKITLPRSTPMTGLTSPCKRSLDSVLLRKLSVHVTPLMKDKLLKKLKWREL